MEKRFKVIAYDKGRWAVFDFRTAVYLGFYSNQKEAEEACDSLNKQFV